MRNTTTQERIRKIEMELESVKRLVRGRPDFAVDEKNWKKVGKNVKKERKGLYRAAYGAR